MVSICMGTYNGEKYIKQQLDSILQQIGIEDEVIISDDGSTDRTVEIINNYHDTRIKLIKNDKWHGATGNFIHAMGYVTGDYIFLSDQDDVWFPSKYKIMLEKLKKYDLIHSDSVVTDAELNTLNDSFYSLLHNGTGIIKNIKKSTYYGSHMAFRREVYEKALPFPHTNEIGHDLWLGLTTELWGGNIDFIPDRLLYYRRHDLAHCDILGTSGRSVYLKIWGRILMIKYVVGYVLQNCTKK